MHLIITDAWLAQSRAIYLSGTKLVVAGFVAALVLMLVAAGMYHWVFLKGAREGWPVVGALVKLVVKDEFEQRDRFMRENLDMMANGLGEMQAKLMQLAVQRFIPALVSRQTQEHRSRVVLLAPPAFRGVGVRRFPGSEKVP